LNSANVILDNLVIERAENGDKGTYICRLNSSVGQTQASVAFVEVLGKSTQYNIFIHVNVGFLHGLDIVARTAK